MDDSDTAQFVRARQLGCPLSDEADLDGGLRLLSEITAPRVRAFYEQLHNRNIKFRIIRARNTLERILFSQFDLGLVLDSTRRTIIDAGIVADAVLALARDDSDRFEELLSTHSGSAAVPASIREPANLIRQFATLLNEPWVHLAKDWPEIASVLRENDRWYPTETYLMGLQEVRCFITALWNTDPSQFSEKMRGTLLWSMIYCAKRLDRFMKGATGSDLVQASIAGTRAYLYCSKIERASATLNWGSRLSNLCQALILAHRARFFEDRAKYLEHVMWEELGQVQDMLPEEPHALLTSSPMSSPKDTFYLMANAATAFYFGAIMHANFGGERDDALRALHAAQKYFQAASTYFDRVPNGRRLVFQRRARALTLGGRLLLHSGHGGTERALEVLDHAINLLEMLNVADDLEGGLRPRAPALRNVIMRFLEDAWRRPDEGIWEVRGGRQHFTHSKVMAG